MGWPQVPPRGVGFPALESPNLNLPGRIIFITTHFCALQTSCNDHDADDDVDDDDDDDDDNDDDDNDNDNDTGGDKSGGGREEDKDTDKDLNVTLSTSHTARTVPILLDGVECKIGNRLFRFDLRNGSRTTFIELFS